MSKRKKRTRSGSKRGQGRQTDHRRASPILIETPASRSEFSETVGERSDHKETSPQLTGGDVDADWQMAYSVGEEAVGGSVATPDQDVVDALGEALGVPQELDAPVQASSEILAERDAQRWRIEREVARDEEIGDRIG
jgi:hypothetical protein